ncbi:MAG: hypothetical protein ACJA1R_001341 [Flavobacteriales bacterium]|jgi:hypothetical protein
MLVSCLSALPMSKPLLTFLLTSLLVAPACGSDTPSDPGTSGQDTVSGDVSEDTAAPDDTADQDAGEEDTSGEDTTEPDAEDPDVTEDVLPDVGDDTSDDVGEDTAVDVGEDTGRDVDEDTGDDTTPDVIADVMDDTADTGSDTTEDVGEDTQDVAVDVEPDVPVDVEPDVPVDVEPDVPDVWCADTVWRQELPDPPFFDCSRPAGPVGPSRIVANASGYHGLAFDLSGNIIGNDNSSLLRHKSDGTGGLWVPGIGTVQQMSFLLPDEGFDGQTDLVAGDSNGLLRISPAGSTSTLTPDLDIYGVEIGPDGMVYAAGSNGIWRINPATNSYETLLAGGAGFTPHTLTFNADYTLMIIGTLTGFSGGSSDILAYELDCDLNPIGEPLVYGVSVGGGYHDAVNFDICGNLYISDFSNSDLYRVRPGEPILGERFTLGGQVDLLIDWEIGGDALESYGHGFVWGTGQDGWRPDAAYVPLPYADDQVKEILIGIPGVRWDGRGLIE